MSFRITEILGAWAAGVITALADRRGLPCMDTTRRIL